MMIILTTQLVGCLALQDHMAGSTALILLQDIIFQIQVLFYIPHNWNVQLELTNHQQVNLAA
jgi:hypothetical protein